jgi:hypothetical protein
MAAPVTKTLNFPLKGDSSTNLFSKTFACCEINIFDTDLGDIHGGISLDMATTLNGPTHNDLTYTETNLRQGRQLDLTNTFKRDPGSMVVNYTAGVDLSIYGADFNPTKSAGDTLSCGVPLLSDSCSHETPIKIASFTVIDIGVSYADITISALIDTTADMTGDGVKTHRTLTVAGADAKPPADQTYTASPQVIDESVKLPCSLPADEPVNYALGDEASHVNGTVTEGVGIGVQGDAYLRDPIFGDHHLFTVGPFGFHLFDLPAVTFNQINLSAPGQNVDLGKLAPNNVPPQITAITSSGTMIEDKDAVWTATQKSPCDDLRTVWRFSNPNSIEPMVAYGPVAHIVFPDDGIYSGTVTVTDPTGLSTTKDLSPFTIQNADPVANTADKRAEWGDVIKYHVDAFDSSADQGSLTYAWSFGDGGRANGRDVEHVYSTPSASPGYAGLVAVADKDGGVGNAPFHTIVDKRPATLVYTGPISALTKTSPVLSATLTDDHGQPVNGGQVDYSLGGQSASSIVDSTGHSSSTLLLNQGGGDYPLAVTYTGSPLYLLSTASLPGGGGIPASKFRINKRATNVTYLGDLDQRPNHVALLTARVTDELGQPVVGAPVTFTLGAQTVVVVTDSTGLASAGLTLNQGPGAYPLKAIYAGDSNYLPGSAGAMQFSIPKNNGAVAGVAAASQLGAAKAGRAVGSRVGVKRARKAGKSVRHHARLVTRRGR